MAFFLLPFTCTIERPETERERSGQLTKTFEQIATRVSCLYLETSGNPVAGPQEGFQGVLAFYVEPNVDVKEGDRIKDIKGRDGEIIDAGPYQVESAKNVGSPFSGKVHHISCKLKGVA